MDENTILPRIKGSSSDFADPRQVKMYTEGGGLGSVVNPKEVMEKQNSMNKRIDGGFSGKKVRFDATVGKDNNSDDKQDKKNHQKKSSTVLILIAISILLLVSIFVIYYKFLKKSNANMTHGPGPGQMGGGQMGHPHSYMNNGGRQMGQPHSYMTSDTAVGGGGGAVNTNNTSNSHKNIIKSNSKDEFEKYANMSPVKSKPPPIKSKATVEEIDDADADDDKDEEIKSSLKSILKSDDSTKSNNTEAADLQFGDNEYISSEEIDTRMQQALNKNLNDSNDSIDMDDDELANTIAKAL